MDENNLNPMPSEPLGQPVTPEKPPEAPTSSIKTPKSKKKKLIILGVVLVLLAAGAAGYWFFIRKDKATDSNNQTNNSENHEDHEEIPAAQLPDTVAYAFRTASDKPHSIFWRPAAGGERTEVGPLAANAHPTYSAVHGQQVVYAIEGEGERALWYSKDAGKTYGKLLALAASDQVTSLIFSADGSKVVAAVINEGTVNTVKEIDASTKAVKDLFNGEKIGVFLEAYSVAKGQILYFEGCYGCDGAFRQKLLKRDLKTNTNSSIFDLGTEESVTDLEVRADFEELIMVKARMHEGGEFEMGGPGAPYTIVQRQLASGSETTIATVTAGGAQAGYMNDGKTLVYTSDKQLFNVKDGKANLLFESSSTIIGVFFVSDTNVITATGTFENFDLNNYDVAGKATTKILSGDANTVLFGITTK